MGGPYVAAGVVVTDQSPVVVDCCLPRLEVVAVDPPGLPPELPAPLSYPPLPEPEELP